MSLIGQYELMLQLLSVCGGPTRGLVPPANRLSYWPTQRSHMAVRHVLDVPMRADCPNIPPACRILCRPTQESRTAAHPALGGPVRGT